MDLDNINLKMVEGILAFGNKESRLAI